MVYLDCGEEDSVLEGVTEVTQHQLQPIGLSVSDVLLAIQNVIQLLGHHGEHNFKQLIPNLLLTMKPLQHLHLHPQYLIPTIITLHITPTIIPQCLLHTFDHLHLLLRKHRHHIRYHLTVQIRYQLQISPLSLHKVLHLQVLVLGNERVLGTDPLGNEFSLDPVPLRLQSADYHVLHLEFQPVYHPDYLLLDVTLSTLAALLH